MSQMMNFWQRVKKLFVTVVDEALKGKIDNTMGNIVLMRESLKSKNGLRCSNNHVRRERPGRLLLG